jgi:hypothetical protein
MATSSPFVTGFAAAKGRVLDKGIFTTYYKIITLQR